MNLILGILMATIFPRENKDGSIVYRVIIRRKNVPTLCMSFGTEKEAHNWVSVNEEFYVENPHKYLASAKSARLYERRKREFLKKKILRTN